MSNPIAAAHRKVANAYRTLAEVTDAYAQDKGITRVNVAAAEVFLYQAQAELHEALAGILDRNSGAS
jgi:hypothetical protein